MRKEVGEVVSEGEGSRGIELFWNGTERELLLKMATSCKHVNRVLKKHLFKSGTMLVRGLTSTSDGDNPKHQKSSEPLFWGPEKEAAKPQLKMKSIWEEPIPEQFRGDHLPNPVENTEREIMQELANPNRKNPFDSKYYTKAYGISKEVYAWLHWDLNINDNDEVLALIDKNQFEALKEDQRYLDARTKAVGHELGAAHFILSRGGAVKFLNRDQWFKKDTKDNYSIPRTYVDNIFVEAIDVSNMPLTYPAFENLRHLSHLRYLKMHNCPYVDDWCLSHLKPLKHCLQFLDISNCQRITDNGLSALHCLSNLQGLRMSELENVRHLGLLTLLLEEHIPGLKILGVTKEDMKPPSWQHRGERRLVRALLGYTDTDEVEDYNKQQEESYKNKNDEEKNDTTVRRIIRVD